MNFFLVFFSLKRLFLKIHHTKPSTSSSLTSEGGSSLEINEKRVRFLLADITNTNEAFAAFDEEFSSFFFVKLQRFSSHWFFSSLSIFMCTETTFSFSIYPINATGNCLWIRKFKNVQPLNSFHKIRIIFYLAIKMDLFMRLKLVSMSGYDECNRQRQVHHIQPFSIMLLNLLFFSP